MHINDTYGAESGSGAHTGKIVSIGFRRLIRGKP
jgi:hypothetical protein